MLNFPNVIHKLHSISIRILTVLFWELHKVILKFIERNQCLRIAKKYEKDSGGDLTQMREFYKAQKSI